MKEKTKPSVKSKAGKGKKSADKKNSAARSSAGSAKDSLLKELRSLIKDIDEDGLLFLIKQANVLIYNKKVDEYNSKAEELAAKTGGKRPAVSDKYSMDIKEADDGSSFIFVINRERKFFTLEEMRKIVRVCHQAKDEADASKRLYAWFRNNRGDVINDIGIESPGDSSLITMYNYIIKRYTVK